MKGKLVLISSPSGGGKTTIIEKILEKYPDKFIYSISSTTRKPRFNEVHGKDYFFLTEPEFKKKIEQNQFLEWEKVHGYYYGTDAAFVEKCLDEGKYVLLDLDVNGALNVAKRFKDQALTIFLAPPSMDELKKRLRNRKTDSIEEINKRLERIPLEMEKSRQFDYIVINDQLDKTVNQVLKIIDEMPKGMNTKIMN